MVRDERGQMAGMEAVVFGVLVLVVGVLLVGNAWGVIDAKTAAQEAAREAARAYVTAPEQADPSPLARLAGVDTLQELGYHHATDAWVVQTQGEFERCAVATWEVKVPVPVFLLPWLHSGVSAFTAVASDSERVDPYRSGVGTPNTAADCGGDQAPAG
jgi:hypothetical protein